MSFQAEPYDDGTSSAWLICAACATQFPTADRSAQTTCPICDDPRQYTPPSGQSFTTLATIRSAGHRNDFIPYEADARLTSIVTTPKFAIGQRAVLVQTPKGNVLWDCIALLDDETVARVRELGGLAAIVISHPHYYSTHVQWARAFGCPVYLASEDAGWATLRSRHQVLLTETETPIGETGFTAVKAGGHFPGSLVGLFDGRLLVADTLMTTPAGLGSWKLDAQGTERKGGRPEGLNTYAFMWSIPNMIPLGAEEVVRMWGVLKGLEFKSTHGAFLGSDVTEGDVKARVLESMRIQMRSMGYGEHKLMEELQ